MYTNIGNTELSKIKSNFYRYIRKKKMLMLIKEGKLNQYKNMELDFKEAFEVYLILKLAEYEKNCTNYFEILINYIKKYNLLSDEEFETIRSLCLKFTEDDREFFFSKDDLSEDEEDCSNSEFFREFLEQILPDIKKIVDMDYSVFSDIQCTLELNEHFNNALDDDLYFEEYKEVKEILNSGELSQEEEERIQELECEVLDEFAMDFTLIGIRHKISEKLMQVLNIIAYDFKMLGAINSMSIEMYEKNDVSIFIVPDDIVNSKNFFKISIPLIIIDMLCKKEKVRK